MPGRGAPATPPPAGPRPSQNFQAPPPAGPSPQLNFQAPSPAGPCRRHPGYSNTGLKHHVTGKLIFNSGILLEIPKICRNSSEEKSKPVHYDESSDIIKGNFDNAQVVFLCTSPTTSVCPK